MGFRVVSKNPRTAWFYVDANGTSGDTLYVGQIVATSGDGVAPLGAASGAANSTTVTTETTYKTPWGVVIGTNYKDDTGHTDSTYGVVSVTSNHTTHDNFTVERALQDGIGIPKGDKQAMVKVALITAETVLKGPIYATSYGTALSEYAATAAGTTGVSFTSAATLDGVADQTTMYCRSGANMGISRVRDDTSTSAITCDSPFPYDIAIGDDFVHIAGRVGVARMQFDSESMCILGNSDVADAGDYFLLDVIALDLSTSGEEYAIFRFNAYNFLGYDVDTT